MKNRKHFRRFAAMMLVLALAVPCFGALADDSSSYPAAQSETVAALLEVPDFKFFDKEEGIGSGVSCPVYTAPSEDSLRLADGKACCNMNTRIAVAGYTDDGWLLVKYEIKDEKQKDSKKVRVGYIPPNYAKGAKTGRGKMKFVSIPLTLAEEIEITDNPRESSTPYGTLPAGTEITILDKYTYSRNWWYVETRLDGVLTRGFIDRGVAALLVDGTVYHSNEELGLPVESPEHTGKIGTVTIGGTTENAWIVREEETSKSHMVARVWGGETYPCYGTTTGEHDRDWYYIWVDGVWGWTSSAHSTFTADE